MADIKSSLENLSTLQKKLNIEVPVHVVTGAFERVYQDIQKQVTVKGFRKGKAPMATLKSMYADKVKQDVAQDLIRYHYSAALSEHKLEPLSNAEFEFEDPSEQKQFSFSATFEIRPTITLKKYEGLEVIKEKYEDSEERVDKVLENIRASKATKEVILEVRPAKTGDIAVVNFEGFVDGKPLENGSGQDHELELGSNSFIAGFEEGIVGMNIGAEKTLNLNFPTPYHSAELAGKPVEFKVRLNSLKKKVLPELTNEFLATMGGPSDLEGLKKTIREDLAQSEKKKIEDAFKNRLLKSLIASNPIEVPASLLKDQKAALIEDFHKRMHDQGMSHAEYEDYVKKWDKDFEKTATEMIQSSFLIDELARKHDLHAKQEDLDKKFSEYAKQTGIEETRIREFYSKPEQTSRLTYQITEDKVVEMLTKSAKIKELPKSQMPAE
jgi:trigger factor